jgi:hypothetical protein
MKTYEILWGVLLAASLLQPACKAQQCTPSALTPNEPTPALECAAGQLCYQGQCIRACNAGQEGAAVCASGGECDGARPNCVEFSTGDSFCSACEQGEFCVQTLNICQPINEVVVPPEPMKPAPGAPKPPAPLDAGVINPGLKLTEDGGVNVIPPDRVITQVGLIDVARIDDFSAGPNAVVTSRAVTRMFDVEDASMGRTALDWEVDAWDDLGAPSPPAIRTVLQINQECTLFGLDTSTSSATAGANFGSIVLDNHADFPMSIARTTITYLGPDYVEPVVPAALYTFSDSTTGHFIVATSMGGPPTDGNWPEPTSNGHHIPFALITAPETLMAIQNGFTVMRSATDDLLVRWDPIKSGSVPGEKVVLRFRGTNAVVRCDQVEGPQSLGTIEVRAQILQDFITAEGIGGGTTIPVYMERAFEERLDIRPAVIPGSMTEPPETYVIDVSIRVRHTLIGRLRFQ